jgi:H+/gluconate symporter-like permease
MSMNLARERNTNAHTHTRTQTHTHTHTHTHTCTKLRFATGSGSVKGTQALSMISVPLLDHATMHVVELRLVHHWSSSAITD